MKIQPLAWAFFFMTAISANAGERLTIAMFSVAVVRPDDVDGPSPRPTR